MRGIIDACKLIRLPYLVALAFVLFASRELIIAPILAVNNHSVQLPLIHFLLLCLSSLLLAAAGYTINDYFDAKNDRILRPKKAVVGKSVNRISAIKLHATLNIIAILIAVYVSYAVHNLKLSLFFILASTILWFYSSALRGYALFGKSLISLMFGAIPLVYLLFEIPLLRLEYADFMREHSLGFIHFIDWCLGYSFLLFFASLSSNLTKDSIKRYIINEEKMSLPVKYVICVSQVALITFSLFFSIRITSMPLIGQIFLLVFILLPNLYSLFMLITNENLRILKVNYKISKIVWLFAVLSCLLFPYIIKNYFL